MGSPGVSPSLQHLFREPRGIYNWLQAITLRSAGPIWFLLVVAEFGTMVSLGDTALSRQDIPLCLAL